MRRAMASRFCTVESRRRSKRLRRVILESAEEHGLKSIAERSSSAFLEFQNAWATCLYFEWRAKLRI